MGKIHIRETLNHSFYLIKKNFLRYIIIFILIESLLVIGFNEILKNIFNLALISGKVKGITNSNFLEVLANPLVILSLLVLLIVTTILVVLQIVVTYYYTSNDYKTHKTSYKKVLSVLKKIKPKHLFILIIYIFLIMPNGNLGTTSGLTSRVHIPSFILDSLLKNIYFVIFYYSMIIIAFYLNLRLFYTFTIFINEDLSFVDSMKKSFMMTKKNLVKIFSLVLLVSVFSLLLIVPIYFMNYGLFKLFGTLFTSQESLFLNIFQNMTIFIYFIVLSFASILIIQITVVSYNQLEGHTFLKNDITKINLIQNNKYRYSTYILGFFLVIILVTVTLPTSKFYGTTKIVSHRGESILAIENTIDSLKIANTYKPDYVEIDIQQTSDNHIIVFHDYRLTRLTNRKRTEVISSLTLNELKSVVLEQNSLRSSIATLEEYLSVAKSLEQKIMIEIKTNHSDTSSFTKDIMEIVTKLEMDDMVIFQSLDLSIILKLKNDFPQTTVGYILGVVTGGLEHYNIDFYSIEASSVTQRVLNDLNRYHQSLFVWTVNTEEDISIFLQLNAAGIITDYTHVAVSIKNDLLEDRFSNILFKINSEILSFS